MIPNDRKYTKEHEWILNEAGRLSVGITDHAQQELGDIVYVELPAAGDAFEAGDSFAVVESVKAVSNVYLSFAGVVVEVNRVLEDEPELLNQAPYEHCIAIFEANDADESGLLSAREYEAFLSEIS